MGSDGGSRSSTRIRTDANDFTPGNPIVVLDYTDGGNPVKLQFVRHKDYVNVGLDYSPEFTNSMAAFAVDPNAQPPVQVSTEAGDYEVVQVPFPLFDATGRKATSQAARVVVTEP